MGRGRPPGRRPHPAARVVASPVSKKSRESPVCLSLRSTRATAVREGDVMSSGNDNERAQEDGGVDNSDWSSCKGRRLTRRFCQIDSAAASKSSEERMQHAAAEDNDQEEEAGGWSIDGDLMMPMPVEVQIEELDNREVLLRGHPPPEKGLPTPTPTPPKQHPTRPEKHHNLRRIFATAFPSLHHLQQPSPPPPPPTPTPPTTCTPLIKLAPISSLLPPTHPTFHLPCPHCPLRFSSHTSLSFHYVKDHARYQCPFCYQIITSVLACKTHLFQEHQRPVSNELVRNWKMNDDTSNNNAVMLKSGYRCPLCFVMQADVSKAKDHYRLVHNVSVVPKEGVIRGEWWETDDSSEQGGGENNDCVINNEVVVSDPIMILDIRRHHHHQTVVGKNHPTCPFCPFSADQTRILKLHVKSKHLTDPAWSEKGGHHHHLQ